MSPPRARLAAALTCVLAASACAHTTVIRSEPDGAQIHVNGVPLGKAPVEWVTRSGLPDEAFARAELEGHSTARDVRIGKGYRADASLLLLLPGIFPYFFSARFEDEVTIRLEPRPASPPGKDGQGPK